MSTFLANTNRLQGTFIYSQGKDDKGVLIEDEKGKISFECSNEYSGRVYAKINGKRGMEKDIKVRVWDELTKGMVEKTIAWADRNKPASLEGVFDDKLFIFNDGVKEHKFLHRYDLAEFLKTIKTQLVGKAWDVTVDMDSYIFNGKGGVSLNIRTIKPLAEGSFPMHTFEGKLYFTDDVVAGTERNPDGSLKIDAETLVTGIKLNTYIKHRAWIKETEKNYDTLLPYPTTIKVKPEAISPEIILKLQATMSPFEKNDKKIYVMGYEGYVKKDRTEAAEITIKDLTPFERRMVEAGVRTMDQFKEAKSKGKAENQVLLTAPAFAFENGTEIEAEMKYDKIFAISEAIIKGEDPERANKKQDDNFPSSIPQPPVNGNVTPATPANATEAVFGNPNSEKFPF